MPCSKRMRTCYAGCLHRRMVEDYRCAREAQLDRAEQHGVGYATETRDFYQNVEPSLTFKAWLLGMAHRLGLSMSEQQEGNDL